MCDPKYKKAETEYVTSDIGYRKLAKKYNVPLSTLSHQAAIDKWVEKRKAYQEEVARKTVQKTAEKISEDQSELAASLNRSALKFAQRVHDKLEGAQDIKPMDLLRLAQVWQILHDSLQKGEEVTEDQIGGLCMMPGRTDIDE